MSKLDLEWLEGAIIQIIKDNLPAKLLEIDVDKNDGLVLDQIPNANYFTTFGEEVNNVNEFIFYGYNSRSSQGIGPATNQLFQMMILVFFSTFNNELEDENRKKSFRYTRAIKEILQAHYGDIGNSSTLKITDAEPVNFQLNEESPLMQIAGVEVSGNFA